MKYQNQSKCILLVYIQFLLDQIWRRAQLNCDLYAAPLCVLALAVVLSPNFTPKVCSPAPLLKIPMLEAVIVSQQVFVQVFAIVCLKLLQAQLFYVC